MAAGDQEAIHLRGNIQAPTLQDNRPLRLRDSPLPGRQEEGSWRLSGGGLLGGLLGGMLFSSLGFGGMGGGFGGSGIGMIEILLLLGLGYFIFKMVKRRRGGEDIAYQTSYQPGAYQTETFPSHESESRTQEDDVSVGIRHIREMRNLTLTKDCLKRRLWISSLKCRAHG